MKMLKAKCVISFFLQIELQTGDSKVLQLVGQTVSPVPNSTHWLIVLGWLGCSNNVFMVLHMNLGFVKRILTEN